MTPEEKLAAQSRYPSQIKKKIFLGNFVNATNLRHMNELGITRVIGLTPKKDENLEKADIEYIHYEYNEEDKPKINYQVILEDLGVQIEEEKTLEVKAQPNTLIYCLSGMLSASVIMSYLIHSSKMMKELAAA